MNQIERTPGLSQFPDYEKVHNLKPEQIQAICQDCRDPEQLKKKLSYLLDIPAECIEVRFQDVEDGHTLETGEQVFIAIQTSENQWVRFHNDTQFAKIDIQTEPNERP